MAWSHVFVFATIFLQGVNGLCGSSSIPNGTNVLQNIAIYTNSAAIYRVSVASLTSSGFTAVATSGKAKAATADNTMCPLATCMMELATNQKNADLSILQQDNWLGGLAPAGYTLVTATTKMYCVRTAGDCGADVPLWRYYKYTGANGFVHAYSFDSSVAYAGYTRELTPVCYFWTTTTAVSTCGDGIVVGRLGTLASYSNSASLLGANRDTWFTTQTSTTNPTEFAYQSYTKVSDITKVATTMSANSDALQCNCLQKLVQVYDKNTGWLGSAMAPGLGSRFDHKFYLESQPEANQPYENYQTTGEVFYCVLSQGTCGATVALKKWFNIFEINTIYTTGDANPGFGYVGGQTLCYTWSTTYVAPAVCTVPATVTNGQITYIQAGQSVSYMEGTVAQLVCNPGYGVSGTQNITCTSTAAWSPTTFGTCAQVCSAFTTDANGVIAYSQATYFSGTTATLTCNDTTKYSVNGVSTATCGATGAFSPTTLGTCTRFCPALTITNSATISYFESDGTTAVAAAPYYEGYRATFTCTGTLIGTATATCTNNAWIPNGSCSA